MSVELPSQECGAQKKSVTDFLGVARIFFVKAFSCHLPKTRINTRFSRCLPGRPVLSLFCQIRCTVTKSLRATAKAIQISPQYYSEVEKGRSNTFTSERLKMLVHFLHLDENETHTLYDMAAQSRTSNDIVTPQDCADYMLGNSYVVEALRLSMETGAGEKEWRVFLDDLKARKG